MNQLQIREVIFNILANLSGKTIVQLKTYEDSTTLSVIGIDSIATVQLILALEENLEISIPEDKLDKQHLGTIAAILHTAQGLKN